MERIFISPIRTLLGSINYALENYNQDFLNAISSISSQKKIKIKLDSSGKFKTPKVSSGLIINMSEPFLCYLWCMCYYAHVYYNEGIVPEISKKADENSTKMVDDAKDLKDWAKSIVYGYVEWPKDLPCPNVNSNPYIQETNHIFIFACLYIFGHEFAHLTLNHFKDGELQILQKEVEADEQSFDWILSGLDGKKYQATTGILIGLCCLILLGENSEKDSNTHPGFIKRIETYLQTLKSKIDNYNSLEIPYMLMIGSILWEWDKMFIKDVDFYAIRENPKDLFKILNKQYNID